MQTEPQAPTPLRIGLIGPGQIADERLIPALGSIPGAVFWSVASRDLTRATAFATKHGAQAPAAAHTDIAALLADPALDAVIIATPDRLHAAQAVIAANAGKHVFLEKPMATSSDEAKQILEAVEKAKVKLAVGYHLRFHAGHQKLEQAVKAGTFGKLRHMRVCWTMKAEPSDWRAAAATGRWWSLGATGTHALDMVRWLMLPTCGPIVELRSVLGKGTYGGPHDETAVVSLRFESGATAEVTSSVVFRAPRVIELYGSLESAVCTDTLGPRGTGSIKISNAQMDFTPVDPYSGELSNFFDSIRSGASPLVDGAEGAANIALLERASAGD